MSQSYVPTPQNLRAPSEDIWSQPDGRLSDTADRYLRNLTQLIQQIGGIRVFISGSDATTAVQTAVNQAIAQGGGMVILPVGSFTISTVRIPAGSPPIWIVGQGPATILTRNVGLPAGVGIFDISSSNVTLSDFTIDGGVTVPVGLRYNADFSTAISPSDPMAPSLTTNTSIWVHGGNVANFSFVNLILRHAGGYSILLDATTGDISAVNISSCWLVQNRPTLFGIAAGDLIYGSWNGGILAKSDGRAASGAQSGVISNLLVQGCRFQRNNGNCAWMHGYGFSRFSSNVRFIGNQFQDCGLDGIFPDICSGGVVEGNSFHRIGYTTQTDTDRSVPRWLPGLNATAIDSGVIIGINYIGNSMTSINGGCVDLDGHGHSSLVGNVCRIPKPGQVGYDEDQIAITGPTNSGNGSYGFNGGNTYLFAEGMENIDISGNTFINLPAGSIRLYSGRFCKVVGNIFDVPAVSSYAPIQMGPQSADPTQRCKDNIISHNSFRYSPAAPAPCVKEDNSIAAFDPGDVNSVFGNQPIITSTAPFEFLPDGGSGSPTYAATVWFP